MLNITILSVGKIKKDYFFQAMEEYLKRIKPYVVLKNEELKAEPFFDNSDRAKIKEKEGERIINFLEKFPQSKVFILDESGKNFKSTEFSEILFKYEADPIILVIGGTLGLSANVLTYKNSIELSLSAMTLPHELARVILLEQIYRAIAINKNKSYHY